MFWIEKLQTFDCKVFVVVAFSFQREGLKSLVSFFMESEKKIQFVVTLNAFFGVNGKNEQGE